MKSKKITNFIFIFSLLFLSSYAYSADHSKKGAEHNVRIGVVNFKTCAEKSYLGQKEQTKLESMRSEMVSALEEKEKSIKEIIEKLQNTEYLDALSPEAEDDLRAEYKMLTEEMGMIQNQAYQALNQAQMKMFQSLADEISKASGYIAKENHFDVILNEDSCFFYNRPYDITQLVLAELNRHFEPDDLSSQTEVE